MKQNDLVAILGIGTAVPQHRLDQADTSQRIAEALREYPDSMRWSKRIFKQCGVQTRYTCEPNLLEPAESCHYFINSTRAEIPTTAERMRTYQRESVPLALQAAQIALAGSRVDADDITHLITVSCTGQFLPGLDAEMIKELGLSREITRIPFTFLGCAAGLKAVCLAREITLGQPSAKVLIACVELCTLHIQPSSNRDDLFGASFFGDGASACVVGVAGEARDDIFELGNSRSVLLAESAEEMKWELGNNGFHLYLSPSIPKLIGRFVPEQLEQLMGKERLEQAKLWAIHPGGKGIIDVLEDMYQLDETQTGPSRTVLRDYGNMSSATILFVLAQMKQELREKKAAHEEGVAVAFGPGLTCEMIEIAYRPALQVENEFVHEAHA